MSKAGRYKFLAEPFHCDFSNRLFMGHLGNHMLNAADFHSNERGFGMNYLNTIHKTWVLSRLVIEMEEMPRAYSEFYVETWVESAMRYFTNRNFKVVDAANGKVYGYGRSVWAMIDTDTRQPSDIFAIHDGDIGNYIENGMDCPVAKCSRVNVSDAATEACRMDVKYSDIDVNGHVNSVKYIEHVLDLFDVGWYAENRISRLEVAYVAESYHGDSLVFYKENVDNKAFGVRVAKVVNAPETSLETSGNNFEHRKEDVEICRCKVNFVKE